MLFRSGATVSIGVSNRTALLEVFPDGVRIFNPLRISVVEVGSEVLYRWLGDRHVSPLLFLFNRDGVLGAVVASEFRLRTQFIRKVPVSLHNAVS